MRILVLQSANRSADSYACPHSLPSIPLLLLLLLLSYVVSLSLLAILPSLSSLSSFPDRLPPCALFLHHLRSDASLRCAFADLLPVLHLKDHPACPSGRLTMPGLHIRPIRASTAAQEPLGCV